MPVNWGDPEDISAFKQAALQNGADPNGLDKYISSHSPAATPQAPNPMILPQMKISNAPQAVGGLMPGVAGDTSLLDIARQKKEQSAPQLIQPSSEKPYDPTGKTQAQIMAETGHQSDLDAMNKNPQPSTPPQQAAPQITQSVEQLPAQKQAAPPSSPMQSVVQSPATQLQAPQMQSGILPTQTRITQHAGNYNPGVEVFSKGYARDTNLSAKPGTPVALPQGNWVVDKTYSKANPVGGLHNAENQGYGNMVKAVNKDTGESMIFQHLSEVNAQPGQVLQGGVVIGKTGSSGNTTGPNLGIEYADKTGKIQDIANSPYASNLWGGGQPAQPPAAMQTPQQSVPEQPKPLDAPQLAPQTQVDAAPQSPSMQPPQSGLNPQLLSSIPQPQQEAAKTAIPAITDALKSQGITDPKAISYALATAGHESGFVPKEEVMAQRGINPHNDYIANLQDNYDGGANYKGRGYIQLTGKGNYDSYGKQIGVDLVNHPELANDPDVAAKILAVYMKNSGAADAASKGDYNRARVLVQGRGALNPEFIGNTNAIAQQAQNWQQYVQ